MGRTQQKVPRLHPAFGSWHRVNGTVVIEGKMSFYQTYKHSYTQIHCLQEVPLLKISIKILVKIIIILTQLYSAWRK